jgi:hypothetical protein
MNDPIKLIATIYIPIAPESLVTLSLKPQDKCHSLHAHREGNEKQGSKMIHLT